MTPTLVGYHALVLPFLVSKKIPIVKVLNLLVGFVLLSTGTGQHSLPYRLPTI